MCSLVNLRDVNIIIMQSPQKYFQESEGSGDAVLEAIYLVDCHVSKKPVVVNSTWPRSWENPVTCHYYSSQPLNLCKLGF